MASPYSPVTHVIFDFDGLLASTEAVLTKAFQAVCDPFGKSFTWEIKRQIMGLTPELSSQRVIDRLDLPLTVQEFIDRVENETHKRINEIELMPGALRLIDHFLTHRIPMAIATGNSSITFARRTPHLADILQPGRYFDHLVFAGDDPEVKNGKPDPDVYRVCMSRFKSPPKSPQNVLVFEDAPAGVVSAQAAGMQVVMVPDPDLIHSEMPTIELKSLELFDPKPFSLPPFDDTKLI